MNNNVKIGVLRRLRSGNFKKAQKTLCRLDNKNRHHAYCVMGLVARELGVKPRDMAGKGNLADIKGYGDLYAASGITDSVEANLVDRNDNGTRFLELAQFIESNY